LAPVNFRLVETGLSPSDLRFDGGHVALDFVNSLGGLATVDPRPHDEALNDYDDLLDWSRLTGVLAEDETERLARLARRRPAEAAQAFARALELRALIDRIFRPLAGGNAPTERDLDKLRDAASQALDHGRLTRHGNAFRWSWHQAAALEAPLWPLAYAAVDLLTSGPLERLRRCERCRWLFLDESRNRSRRWCSMEQCGTDVKKERYVERRRERRQARS
jgi:predicted RNA-binding Zn ribbon-like protein